MQDPMIIQSVYKTLTGFLKTPKGKLPMGAEITRDLTWACENIIERGNTNRAKDSRIQPVREDWVELRSRFAPGQSLLPGFKESEYLNDPALYGETDIARVNSKVFGCLGSEFSLDCCILFDYLKFKGQLEEMEFLYASIYKAYDAGAWPCGWVGQYPEGHILAYWPFPEEPVYETKL